ncbi:MAG TPA: Fe-S cluster assembly protein SufD [Anaeromyxobacteraceae bacterium]|nr:Fe-S cluster assembly protein SufD [Anaeromyxobacteraceae bacterium]
MSRPAAEMRAPARAEESLLEQLAARRATAEPEFLAAQRRAAAEAFARLRLPTVKHEDWKYTSLAALAQIPWRAAAPASLDAAGLAALTALPAAPRLVFVNGRYDFRLSDLSGVPEGVFVGSLADALARAPEMLEAWLGRRSRATDHAFAALNTALAVDGAVVVVPPGVAVETTIHVLHVTVAEEPIAVHPRHLLVAGPGAKACVAEIYAGHEGEYLVNAQTEVYAGEGAEVEHHRVQLDGANAFHVGLLEVEQGKESRFRSHAFALGGQLSRLEARALLGSERADCTLEGLYLGRGRQLHDQLVLVDHASPACTSREMFKGILDDRARGVFAGRILVREDAQKTDASQVNSNLLLSDDAEIDTKPQLEIFADDVKCSHGGSVGQLDETALFYLRSRGVEAPVARAMLTYAFAAEVVGRVRPVELRSYIRRLVATRLPHGERLLEAI